MKFIRRLAYFSGGFGIGIVLLMFILSGKETSCDYGIQARTLKNMRLKDRTFSENSLMFFEANKIDTTVVGTMLQQGKVIFSESNTRLDSCNQYVVKGKEENERFLKVRIENCEKSVYIIDAYFDEN